MEVICTHVEKGSSADTPARGQKFAETLECRFGIGVRFELSWCFISITEVSTSWRVMAMSYVVAVPEFVASAASDLSNIGSGLSAANAAAVVPTTAVVAAAGDEVSAAVASLFSGHAKDFQALGARAAAFHGEFVRALSGAGGAFR